MKKLMKAAIILILIGVSGTVVTASVTDVFSFETVKLIESKEIKGNHINSIQINTSSTDIKVVPSESKKIKVEFSGEVSKRLKDIYDLVIKENEGQVEIEVENKALFMYLGIPVMRLKLEVQVPKKEYKELIVRASSGDIQIKEVRGKELSFTTSSGDMDISNVTGVTISAEASSGKIVMKDTEATSLEYEASSGDISLENIRGDIDVITSSGKIELINEELSGNLVAEASSGDVKVSYKEMHDGLLIDFRASSGNGIVNLDGFSYEEKSENEIIGTKGNGKYMLNVRTSSGDFTLN